MDIRSGLQVVGLIKLWKKMKINMDIFLIHLNRYYLLTLPLQIQNQLRP